MPRKPAKKEAAPAAEEDVVLDAEAVDEEAEKALIEAVAKAAAEAAVQEVSKSEEPETEPGETEVAEVLGEADGVSDGGPADAAPATDADDAEDNAGTVEAEAPAPRNVDTRPKTEGGLTVWTS